MSQLGTFYRNAVMLLKHIFHKLLIITGVLCDCDCEGIAAGPVQPTTTSSSQLTTHTVSKDAGVDTVAVAVAVAVSAIFVSIVFGVIIWLFLHRRRYVSAQIL